MALRDEGFTRYTLENKRIFLKSMKRVQKKVGDLRFPFGEISRDFYKSEKAIFKRKSPGFFKDLTDGYKKAKRKKVGFIYPILRLTGAMEKAATRPNAKGSFLRIGKKAMRIGVDPIEIPYASIHNEGGTIKHPGTNNGFGKGIKIPAHNINVPQRKFIFIGPESRSFDQRDRQNQGGRLTRWTNILENYALAVAKQQGFEVKK